MAEERLEREDFEIYLHFPFCVKKCDYCDFLSFPAGEEVREAYAQALIREIRAVPEGRGRSVSSVFLGGGTPSILEASLLDRILQELYDRFTVSPEAEISIEANPGTLSCEKLSVYRAAGVSRLSIGLQSPKDGELSCLGRIHDYRTFLESYELARRAGFDNINVDLMFAIPGQTREGWRENLRTVAALNPEHISAYSLIVEEGTPFSRRKLALPDEESEYGMYEDTAEILGEAGYLQYEISNYARPGFACRHNRGYWERRDYLGLGLGSASLWEETRFRNTRRLETYLASAGEPAAIRRERQKLTREDSISETAFLALRMREGIREESFRRKFGCPIQEVYGDVIRKYQAAGFLWRDEHGVRLTRKGIHVSNRIMADFLL